MFPSPYFVSAISNCVLLSSWTYSKFIFSIRTFSNLTSHSPISSYLRIRIVQNCGANSGCFGQTSHKSSTCQFGIADPSANIKALLFISKSPTRWECAISLIDYLSCISVITSCILVSLLTSMGFPVFMSVVNNGFPCCHFLIWGKCMDVCFLPSSDHVISSLFCDVGWEYH